MKQWPRHTSFPRAGTCPTIRSGNSQRVNRDPRCQHTSAARPFWAVHASADVSHEHQAYPASSSLGKVVEPPKGDAMLWRSSIRNYRLALETLVVVAIIVALRA